MKWSRELRIARRSVRTAIKAASAMADRAGKAAGFAAACAGADTAAPRPSSVPVEVTGFGSNPGRLTMLVHLPTRPPMPGAPLIVLLHGCGQGAAGFARDAGLDRARRPAGHAPLLPEQSDANNHGRCFNWFRPSTRAAGMVKRCRSGRWSPRRWSASPRTRAASLSPDCPPAAP